ncbi:HNH endonuclease [Rhodoferax sp. U2-2l]|uniref:HNH endonuclease n=1 Tax=Rhodoferax sp. U2-2l TaxID=2884000 RepID=UPI001D0A0C59|nr:HNH endonuclease [Rhodoferax sp. U2-2l]MCB8747289.1 HNH endonuclease [Rhodoferax sp. U2-2l]
MNPLQRILVEKAGYDNGFEHVLPSDGSHVGLGSARHPAQVAVTTSDKVFQVAIQSGSATLGQELARTFPNAGSTAQGFTLPTEAALAQWLRRAAALSQALPNQAVTAFEQQVQAELSAMPTAAAQNTEVLRMVRQRVGQQAYRQAMLDYWGSACAVTGLALPQALRASHAKPWAECGSDAERLDVYNGFLLSANLDVLFDSFLVSFSDSGELLVSKAITPSDQLKIGFAAGMCLRWVSAQHGPYLNFHRQRFLQMGR